MMDLGWNLQEMLTTAHGPDHLILVVIRVTVWIQEFLKNFVIAVISSILRVLLFVIKAAELLYSPAGIRWK